MQDFIENDIIFDLETYPNTFTFSAVPADPHKEGVAFEISDRRNHSEQLIQYLRKLVKDKSRLIGFNNIGFDYPVLHHLLEKAVEAKKAGRKLEIGPFELYRKAQSIIDAQNDEDKFVNIIPAHKMYIPQVDLYKIHHFDNKARATSLKMLEFNMKSDDIEDLPFPVGTRLTSRQIDTLLKYNGHDVLQTRLFYYKSLEAIRFRQVLSEKYGKDFTNHNDTKIGKDYFIMRLEEAMPGSCYKQVGKRRVIQQTKRNKIDLKEVVFPYIQYERQEFQAVKKWFELQSIKETKGIFIDILESDLGDLAKYANLRMKRKKLFKKPTEEQIAEYKKDKPLCWIDEIELKGKETKANGGGQKRAFWLCWNVADSLNVVVDGFEFVFGTGGIHGSIESSIVESNDEYVLIDLDVASYYPNLAISNRIYPEHLSDKFCDIYKDVYDERKLYSKGSPENKAMKLALNGVYGDSNSEFSPFYDPKYTMSITINGQLLLCLLSEKLIKIDSLSMIQANTDGLTVRVKRDKQDEVMACVKEWEKLTGLEMERNDYSKMMIRDVNNYIAVYEKGGDVKRKGAYEYDGLDWNKNHSSLVIPKAAEHELLGKGTVEDFITKHRDKYDFMLRTKVPRSSSLILQTEDGAETRQQNICRYYASKAKEAGKLVKLMPALAGKEEEGDRRIGIETGWNVKICNDIRKFTWDIDYEYYISEARKLVDPLKIA